MASCPSCGEPAPFSRRRGRHYCDECELAFDAPQRPVEPQTVFLSYAHRSERDEDFDVSEDLVLLVKEALEGDGLRGLSPAPTGPGAGLAPLPSDLPTRP